MNSFSSQQSAVSSQQSAVSSISKRKTAKLIPFILSSNAFGGSSTGLELSSSQLLFSSTAITLSSSVINFVNTAINLWSNAIRFSSTTIKSLSNTINWLSNAVGLASNAVGMVKCVIKGLGSAIRLFFACVKKFSFGLNQKKQKFKASDKLLETLRVASQISKTRRLLLKQLEIFSSAHLVSTQFLKCLLQYVYPLREQSIYRLSQFRGRLPRHYCEQQSFKF